MANKTRLQTLRHSQDFQRLREAGRRLHVNQWMLISYSKSACLGPRFGWTIPKFVGNAVVRNRIRRWLKEFFRQQLRGGPGLSGLDINVVIKRYDKEFFKHLPHADLDQALALGWQRLHKAT